MPTYEDALALLHDWTRSESLRRHAYAVEAAMAHYAKIFGEDETLWRMTGLLHDLDYERHPSREEHPGVGVNALRELGYPETMLLAIIGHADYTNTPRTTRLARCLYAVDELSGFILAVAYVRPTRLRGMSASSVKKKLKDRAFAAAVSREDIQRGTEELGIDLTTHITNVIAGLQEAETRLGLDSEEESR